MMGYANVNNGTTSGERCEMPSIIFLEQNERWANRALKIDKDLVKERGWEEERGSKVPA